MYEEFGRYYAFFGPGAAVTPEEQRFLARWTTGCRRALDFGAGLCGPALILAELGLEVFAFEPSPVLATLAMDRLIRETNIGRSITLLEGRMDAVADTLEVDFIWMRSVLMLLNNVERSDALKTIHRHSAPGARLLVDVRTPALKWTEHDTPAEQRSLGRTSFRRNAKYRRLPDGATLVQCEVDAERAGRTFRVAEEEFTVRADTPKGLRDLLLANGFEVQRLYGHYDLDREYHEGDEMMVAVAQRKS